MDDDFAAAAGLKRDAGSPPARPPSAKKPRDNRLRECFTITPLEGGGERVVCNYCPDFTKTLQKFNPTKSRTHLTDHCPGVDDDLRKVLYDTTQAAKRSQNAAREESAALAGPSAAMGASTKIKRGPKGRFRPSPAYISIHTENTNMDVTAPIEGGKQILRISFPTDLKLNFDAEENMEGAALCIDGFMNMRPDAVWTASMCSMSSEGTRAGPHCQWSLNPDVEGKFDGGMTRAQMVGKILKTMIVMN